MGACGSSHPRGENDGSPQPNPKKSRRGQDIAKVLLLGAGGSGKSTLFRQMKCIYGTGFSHYDRMQFAPSICENVIESFVMLCNMSDVYQPIADEKTKLSKQLVLQKSLEVVPKITEDLLQHLLTLWADPGIQFAFANRNAYPLPEHTQYFVTRLEEIANPNFLPSNQDIMMCRVRTTGIVESTFQLGKSLLRMYDVGGQRNERKKWINCFEGVTAILFVASLVSYNQLAEDMHTNAMREELNLFEDICGSHWFAQTSIILFLNKNDVFKDKCKEVPLSDYFPEYKGEATQQETSDWIEDQFLIRNDFDRTVYVHLTTATDSDNIRVVFDSVKDTIWQASLRILQLL